MELEGQGEECGDSEGSCPESKIESQIIELIFCRYLTELVRQRAEGAARRIGKRFKAILMR